MLCGSVDAKEGMVYSCSFYAVFIQTERRATDLATYTKRKVAHGLVALSGDGLALLHGYCKWNGACGRRLAGPWN